MNSIFFRLLETSESVNKTTPKSKKKMAANVSTPKITILSMNLSRNNISLGIVPNLKKLLMSNYSTVRGGKIGLRLDKLIDRLPINVTERSSGC